MSEIRFARTLFCRHPRRPAHDVRRQQATDRTGASRVPDRPRRARRVGQPIHVARRIHPRERVTHAGPHDHRTAGDVRRRECRPRRALPALRVEAGVGSGRITRSGGDPGRVHRRPQRVPGENCGDQQRLQHVDRPYCREPCSDRRAASWLARPPPMRCSRRALEITVTIQSSRATRPAAVPVRGSRLRPHSRIRRLRSFGSSRHSGMTPPRASVPMLRRRSIAGATRSTTTRAGTSVEPPRRAEPPSSRRRHCSGRRPRAHCGPRTSAAWPARWTC